MVYLSQLPQFGGVPRFVIHIDPGDALGPVELGNDDEFELLVRTATEGRQQFPVHAVKRAENKILHIVPVEVPPYPYALDHLVDIRLIKV